MKVKDKIQVDLMALQYVLHYIEDTMLDCDDKLIFSEDKETYKYFKLLCKQVKAHYKNSTR